MLCDPASHLVESRLSINVNGEKFIHGRWFSGLAKNDVFAKHLASQYDLWGFKGYKDHYSFTQRDLDDLKKLAKGATLVCTEKDWMKVKQLNGYERIHHISISNKIEGDIDFISWLKAKINES